MPLPRLLAAMCMALPAAAQDLPQVSQGLAGYISMSVPPPPDGFGYGVSLYATAWPLLPRPLRDFQIGLASIWIVPDNRDVDFPLLPTGTVARDHWPERGPSYRDVFQTIEGGLGFWASTRFGSSTAKFRMNGTANGYNHEISSPGFGFGSTAALRLEQMGIAQLSPRLLVPPDGLTFADGTCGELLGYAWMALPLLPAPARTHGLPIPTGGQCWTMFVRAANFQGPVAFYTPLTWSRISRRHPPAIGRGLDARPGLVTGGAIEVNTVPRFVAGDGAGGTFSRIPLLQFPVDEQGRTVLIHGLTHYGKAALYDQVAAWLAGGDMPDGRFDARGARVPPCTARPLSLRQGPEQLPIRGLQRWLETRAFDATTFGLQWQERALTPWHGTTRRGVLPQYCKLAGDHLDSIDATDVPAATHLAQQQFAAARDDAVYSAPAQAGDCWSRPGPKAGPFEVRLADGSVVTYSWYRFVDQPSMQDADLTADERERLQHLVEQLHAHWTPDRDYMPPPASGTVAALDAALLVDPPAGLERGCVPVATRQAAARRIAPK